MQTWNASEAARQAGYAGDPTVIGSRLLVNVSIQAEIKARLAKEAMETDETLKRMSDQARLNASQFFRFEPDSKGEIAMAGVNWEMVRTHGHLVKKISYNRRGKVVLEFYDAQRALELIGKAQGLFQDKPVDVTVHVNLEEWRAKRQVRLEQIEQDEAEDGESAVRG